jgi:DNA polymerase elongation subunit (family B)
VKDLHEIVSALKLLAVELSKTPTQVEFIANSKVSRRQIAKHGYANLCRKAGLEPNTNSQQKKPIEIESRPPKILIFDIETAPILAYVYGLWEQNVSTEYIQKDWYCFSIAGKFVGEKKVHYLDVRDNFEDDKAVCEFAWNLLNEADILVGHNSDKFDIKKLNTRFLFHGLPPIGKKQTIDTLKIARKYFKITSNKLDFIAKFLGVEGKRKSKKFSNQQMWMECCKGNVEAFKENKKYNIQDINVTEAVYDKLKTWDESINIQAFAQKTVCICGNKQFRKDGYRYTKTGVFQRYRCTECQKVHVCKKNEFNKDQKKQLTHK